MTELYAFEKSQGDVFSDVADERWRQDAKWGPQTHDNGTTKDYDDIAAAYKQVCDGLNNTGAITWHDIFLEEVFEAMAEEDDAALEKELIQVIAVAVNWIEDIRRKCGC